MSENDSKFDIWWNSTKVKRFVGAAYSLGAAVVIIGAMFKILHLAGAGIMLGIGMTVEAILFSLGVLDKPHHEYEWHNVFDFNEETKLNVAGGISSQPAETASPSRAVGLNYTETINDDDVKKLSEGIKNLAETAQQFSTLSDVVGSTQLFVKNIDEATEVTGKFINNQATLNGATGLLTTSYQGISQGMETVEKNTKLYAVKVEDINKNLSSINSIYEIQLKNIQAQSEGITQQTERVREVNDELGVIVGDVQKMKVATMVATEETENFKASTIKLAKQVADLNQVYGNMLNALN
jgi:gliding motility-associated protein GldL